MGRINGICLSHGQGCSVYLMLTREGVLVKVDLILPEVYTIKSWWYDLRTKHVEQMFRTDFIHSILNAMKLMFNKMIEGVVLAVETRSRASTEGRCYRVFLISARFIYIGAYPAVYIYLMMYFII